VSARRFEPGETVVLRERLRGRIWAVRPLTMVLDADELWMFYIPPGSVWLAPAGPPDARSLVSCKAPGAEWELEERVWNGARVLSFAWPGAGAAVLYVWDERWATTYWYVNVEAPLQRFELGFDTFDHDLDIVIEPDRTSWRWKDEDVVAEGIRLGVYSAEDEAAFRREAERALRRVLDREPPFDREWADWRPDPAWPLPELPPGFEAR
jgi:hypothetical protein